MRGRLTLLVASLLAPALLLVATLMYRAYQNERVAVSEKLIATARAVAVLADRELREFDAILRTLSASQALAEGDFSAFESIARSALADGARWLVLAEPGKSQVINTLLPPGEPVTTPPFDLPGMEEAMARGERYISNLHYGPAARSLVVSVSRPYGQDAKLRRTLTLLTRPATLAADLELSDYATPDGLVALVDRDNRILARSRDPETYVGRPVSPRMRSLIEANPEGVHDTVTLDGVPVITAFHRAEHSGWVAIVSAPKSALFASTRKLLWTGLALSALLLATAGAFALWILRGLTRGVDALVAGSEAIARGEPVAISPSGLSEMDFVGSAMNRSSLHLRETGKALQNALREMEQRVEERTRRLSETVGELEAFSYSISHDMRAPLRAMHSYASILLADHAPRLDEEARRHLGRIEANAARLELLVRDVLAYSRVAKEQIETRPIELDRYVRDLAAQLLETGQATGSIEVEGTLPAVRAHEAYLSQILTNLIANACKFTAPSTPPRVRIFATCEGSGDLVKVFVSDNGIGIAAADFGRIFQIFGRVHPAAAYDGTGIGLAIVKKAVQRMGGELGLESAPGAGSTFWFTLPRA